MFGLRTLQRTLLTGTHTFTRLAQKLEDFSLETWDHRTHLRLAFLYLTRHGRREGLARIHASIAAFIAHSPLTKRKTGTTYHETMTYFCERAPATDPAAAAVGGCPTPKRYI